MRSKLILISVFLLTLPTFSQGVTLREFRDIPWNKIQKSRAESYGQMMIGNLSYAQDRSLKLYNTVALEAKQQNKEKDLVISTKLLEIRKRLETNQLNLDKLKLILEPQNVTKANWPETKKLVKTIIKDLRRTHGEMKKALELLEVNR